jgi:hypothetical protein
MANELLILPLHLTQSALGQKVEAKPVSRSHRERSQGRAAMHGREVACLSIQTGSPMGRSRGRASPFLAKSVRSGYFQTGRAPAVTVADGSALTPPVRHAVTSDQRNTHPTDEVPRCPWPLRVKVSPAYKSDTKGLADAPATGTGSPRPRPWGCRQRQSRGTRQCGDFERQNLRVPNGPLRSTDQVSPMPAVTKWPDGTSSCQRIDGLRNRFTQPERVRLAVRSR